jgi:hypothetical protein
MSPVSERHPTASEIVAFASGELSPPEQTRIAAHVDECERCADVRLAVLEATKKCLATSLPAAAGPGGDARPQSERLALSPDHEHVLAMLASPASLKTLAGELHVSVARLSRQVREAREFICDHNPRLLQKSYRALESSLGSEEDGEISDGAEATSRTAFVGALDRTASEQFLARRFGAVNVGIHRAVYSADDDAEWERVLWALLSELAPPQDSPPPGDTSAVVAKPPAPPAPDDTAGSSAEGCICANVRLDDAESHEIDLKERVDRPMDTDVSHEAQSVSRGKRARGRR